MSAQPAAARQSRTHLARALCVLGTCALLGAWPHGGGSQARADEPPIAIIVAAKTGVRSISMASLRGCFLGRPVSVGGVRLIPFNHPVNHPLRVRMDRALFQMSTLASQRFWINSRIRGDARPPRTVTNTRLLSKVVAKLPGAISYMDAPTLSMFPELTAVAIDGTAHDDPAYPLR